MNSRINCFFPASMMSGADLTSWNSLAEFGLEQMAMATESASACFRAAESMRKIQMHAAHRASIRHQAVARKLREGGAPADILAVQTDLLSADLRSVAEYWQQLAAVAVQSQIELMGCASHLADTGGGPGFKPALAL